MNCPECKFPLIREKYQSACLVAHEDKLEYTSDGKIHDHTTPCDYGGGIHFRCRNGHKIAVPTYNKCWCGFYVEGEDGGFHSDFKRYIALKMPWKESADYWGRRLRDEPRFDCLQTRDGCGIGGMLTLTNDNTILTEELFDSNGDKV